MHDGVQTAINLGALIIERIRCMDDIISVPLLELKANASQQLFVTILGTFGVPLTQLFHGNMHPCMRSSHLVHHYFWQTA